jgi:hypothetical protein
MLHDRHNYEGLREKVHHANGLFFVLSLPTSENASFETVREVSEALALAALLRESPRRGFSFHTALRILAKATIRALLVSPFGRFLYEVS